ncbi:hypothetical protein [Vibrio phage vB_VpaM_VPs20]|uniref:Uncharacterized protein n=1 Tax=Vibrio phage vB_VpaM_VPs20 TaxID=2978980 RepID=A0A9X9JPX6_9CAUD|nr:hypothetical protein QNH06_gp13 [Vibrio phage vB_VpaM_VPs20]UYD72113.1 hypothetical protein [Vibrio phage vB_VpaM_VPs20]
MALKTRLDKRSDDNDRLAIVDSQTGEIIAMVTACSNNVELEVSTKAGTHIEKPNGFVSKR